MSFVISVFSYQFHPEVELSDLAMKRENLTLSMIEIQLQWKRFPYKGRSDLFYEVNNISY